MNCDNLNRLIARHDSGSNGSASSPHDDLWPDEACIIRLQ
jgi:hypothetical protein